jgi:hypothetical protein
VIINFGNEVQPHDIRENSTGRLAAKFLRTFFQVDEDEENVASGSPY